MTNTNAEFVFVGNTTYNRINDELEKSKGTLRVGPVLDPHTGGVKSPEWLTMNLIGMYTMHNDQYRTGEARIVKDSDGRSITLERAIEKIQAVAEDCFSARAIFKDGNSGF